VPEEEEQDEPVDESVGRLPIFSKNTDFAEEDYRLKSLEQEQQPKKFLKSKSPMKNKLFREDDATGSQEQMLIQEDGDGLH
jgi:hypothetical protein